MPAFVTHHLFADQVFHALSEGQAKTAVRRNYDAFLLSLIHIYWEEIKREKGGVTSAAAHAAAVPRCLPALMRAKKVQKRLGLAMFSSKSPENAVCALKSAVERLDKGGQNCDNVKEELGDVLFAAVAVGRQSGIDCEELLAETCDRYIQADSERERCV